MTARRAAVAWALTLALASGCDVGSGQDPAPTAPAAGSADATIRITEDTRQTIAGWGASVVGDTPNDPLVVPGDLSQEELGELDRLVFEEAGITIVRVFAPGYGTQLESGDLEPRPEDPRFQFMRRVVGLEVRFMLTGADARESMKDGKALRHGSEPAYADYLASVLRVAKQDVGVPFAYAAIANEPDNSAALLTMTPEQATLVYETLAGLVESEDLGAKLVLGDNTGWDDTLQYVRPLLDAGLGRAAAAVASHAYRGSVDEMRSVAQLARENGLSVWQTEWGTGCPTCPNDPTMESGLAWSKQIAAGLVEGDVTAWFTFRAVADSAHGPGDALIVRQRDHLDEPFYTTKRFDVFRHYSSVAPPGAVRLHVTREGTDAPAVAFRNDDELALVVTNSGHSALRLAVDFGERTGTLSGRRTTQDQSFASLAPLRYDSSPVVVTLPGESVTTLTLR